MPELIRLYLRNIALGAVLGVLFTGALIGLNVANLRHLVLSTHGGYVAVALLAAFNTLVFAGVQFGIAVMRMASETNPPAGGRRAPATPRLHRAVPQVAPQSLRK